MLAMLLLMQPRPVCFPGCEHTLVAYVQLFIHQYPQVLLGRAVLKPFIPQSVLILGVALTHVQDLAPGLVEPHDVQTGPLSSLSRSLWMASHPSGVLTAPHSLVSSANVLRVHSIPLSMSLMKILNSTSPSTDPLSDTTCHRSFSGHLWM